MPKTIEETRERMIASALAFQAAQMFVKLQPNDLHAAKTLTFREEILDAAVGSYYSVRKAVGG